MTGDRPTVVEMLHHPWITMFQRRASVVMPSPALSAQYSGGLNATQDFPGGLVRGLGTQSLQRQQLQWCCTTRVTTQCTVFVTTQDCPGRSAVEQYESELALDCNTEARVSATCLDSLSCGCSGACVHARMHASVELPLLCSDISLLCTVSLRPLTYLMVCTVSSHGLFLTLMSLTVRPLACSCHGPSQPSHPELPEPWDEHSPAGNNSCCTWRAYPAAGATCLLRQGLVLTWAPCHVEVGRCWHKPRQHGPLSRTSHGLGKGHFSMHFM
jgi:hypothetical protein